MTDGGPYVSMTAGRLVLPAEEVHVGVGAHHVPLDLLPQLRVLRCTTVRVLPWPFS